MKKYMAFGLCIASEIDLLGQEVTGEADVCFKYGKCPELREKPSVDYGWIKANNREALLTVEDVGRFYAHDGCEVIMEVAEPADESRIRLFLLGTCMGAILYQRGIIPLHGSCVCKDGEALVITGISGAGKSTTAAEFLTRGWKLMSDDITPIIELDGVIHAQSTYPGQKMWEDTIARSQSDSSVVENVIREEDGREKYQLYAGENYINATVPIRYGVFLIPEQEGLLFDEAIGFTKADILMRNLYRAFLAIDSKGKSRQLGMCIRLGQQLRLFIVRRPQNESTETQIVDWILEQIKRK